MGVPVNIAAHQPLGQTRTIGRRLLLVIKLVRYRFFLFAGLLP